MNGTLWSQLKFPLAALVVGIIPFFVMVGTSQTTVVNGIVVRDEAFNIGGIVLAVLGLFLAISSIRPLQQRARATLAIIAAMVCLVQLVISVGLVPRSALTGWFAPTEEGLPILAYQGLDAANRGIPDQLVANSDEPTLRRSILNYTANTMMDVNQHVDYADLCFGGRYRLDAAAMRTLPDLLTEADRQDIADRVAADRRPMTEGCTPAMTEYRMGEIVDAARQKQDIITVLVAGYHQRFP